MDCDGHVAAHLARSLTDLLLEPYLPRRLGNWARGGIEADGSSIQNRELRVRPAEEPGEQAEDSNRSLAEECSVRKYWPVVVQIAECMEQLDGLRAAMCTGQSQRQQQKSGLQPVVQILAPPRLDTENSNLTARNQMQVCP